MTERSKEIDNLFTHEFRRETVEKMVRGLVADTIKFDLSSPYFTDENNLKNAATAWGKFAGITIRYCSGKYHGKELDDLEQEMFKCIVELRTYGALKEQYTPSKIEQDVAKLNARMDSTNNLMIEVLATLKKILEIFESLGEK